MSTLGARRAELAQRFAAQVAARDTERAARQERLRTDLAPEESSSRFLTAVEATVQQLGRRIADLGKHASPGSEAALIRSCIAESEARLREATRFLTPYDVKKTRESLDGLRKSAAAAEAQYAPRERFRFKSRELLRRRYGAPTSASVSDSSATVAAAATAAARAATAAPTVVVDETVVEGLRDQEVVIAPGELERKGRSADIRIADCEGSTVLVLDTLSAAHLHRIARCTVFLGAVAGSVLLDDCRDCTVLVASRQIRIHHTTNTTFHLHVLSNPIIEHCTEVRVAPLRATYLQMRAQHEAAGLAVAGAEGMWRKVNDFGWHKVQHSPHWREAEAHECRVPCAGLAGVTAPGADEDAVVGAAQGASAPSVGQGGEDASGEEGHGAAGDGNADDDSSDEEL